jgi:predicted DNA-binding protein
MKRPAATRQIHVRVSPELKKAVKMFCVRDSKTEQSWIHALIEDELRRKAPDLWAPGGKEVPKATRH